MLYFTEFIDSDNTKYMFGWSMIGFLLIMIFANLIIILLIAGKFIFLLFKKAYNYINKKLNYLNLK
jgi:hypothetical protein